MRQRLSILCLLCLFTITIRAQYISDSLGDNYVYRNIQMPDDYDGKVICTLIKKPALPNTKQALLYIHGYNDYFFQRELGDSIEAYNYNFYALDLRKYGRSILPHQDPFFCKNLNEYFADIDTALSIIHSEGNDKVILMGHSTGGLISSLYLDYKKDTSFVKGIILNSPFLDMNMHPIVEAIGVPVIAFIGKLFPRIIIQSKGSGTYAQSLLSEYHGEWEFNKKWKMENGHPKRAGWLNAIHQGHKKVQKSVHLDCPILLLSSDKSNTERSKWDQQAQQSDIVLDVRDIQKYGLQLSDNVTSYMIPNGMHDLILSNPEARNYTYSVIKDWLNSFSQ